MLEYLAIKITTPEIEDLVAKYQIPKTHYELNNYLIHDPKMECFIIEHTSSVNLDLLLPTLELFEEALLMLSFGITIDEIKERLNA